MKEGLLKGEKMKGTENDEDHDPPNSWGRKIAGKWRPGINRRRTDNNSVAEKGQCVASDWFRLDHNPDSLPSAFTVMDN